MKHQLQSVDPVQEINMIMARQEQQDMAKFPFASFLAIGAVTLATTFSPAPAVSQEATQTASYTTSSSVANTNLKSIRETHLSGGLEKNNRFKMK